MTARKLEVEVANLKAVPVNDDLNSDKNPSLKGDWLNIFLLLMLYTMQGIAFGLASVMPIILQSNKNVSYNDQAIFSLVSWPNSLKLIWAPLVDGLYVQNIGRRRSWLIPVQYLMDWIRCNRHLAVVKLIDAGVPKDSIVVVHTSILAVKIIVPFVVAKYTSGPKPLNTYLTANPIRLFWNISFLVFIYYTPKLITMNGLVNIPIYYYALLLFILSIHTVLPNIMAISIVSFFCRISDSRFGVTYMTLMNTFLNLGGAWSSSLAIEMVDFLTFKECSLDHQNNCSTESLKSMCKTNGGDCVVIVNGYYVETAVCTMIGIVWFWIFRIIFKNFQIMGPSHWLVNIRRPSSE